MRLRRALKVGRSLLSGAACAAVAIGAVAHAQSPAAPPPPHPAKPKPAPHPAAAGAAKLLGQYDDWGAYAAAPGGKKICFVVARPASAQTDPPNRPRNQPYLFITTRPADRVVNEVSIDVGYPFRVSAPATAAVGQATFALYTQGDGAWMKSLAQEGKMVDAMRSGDTVVVKGQSVRGTATTDTYSLKGLSGALTRAAQDCK